MFSSITVLAADERPNIAYRKVDCSVERNSIWIQWHQLCAVILVVSTCKSKKCEKLSNFRWLISSFIRWTNNLPKLSLLIFNVQQIGIDPPRGVLMYGPPGCGKTMLAKARVGIHKTIWSNKYFCSNPEKAVAHHTTASFIRVVGSEFVQKYLGEGPRMVRDVFRLAKENSPRKDLKSFIDLNDLKFCRFWSR